MACTSIHLETYGNSTCRVRIVSDCQSDVDSIIEYVRRIMKRSLGHCAYYEPQQEAEDAWVGGFDVPDDHAVKALRTARWRANELVAARTTRQMHWDGTSLRVVM